MDFFEILLNTLITNPSTFIVLVLGVVCIFLLRLFSSAITTNKELQSDIIQKDNKLDDIRDELFTEKKGNLDKIIEQESHITQLVRRINGLDNAELAQRKINNNLQLALDKNVNEFLNYRDTVTQKQDSMQSQIDELSQSLDAERVEKQNLEAILKSEYENRTKLQQQILDKQTTIASMTATLGKRDATIIDKNKAIDELETEKALLTEQLEILKRRLSAYETQQKESTESIKTMSEQMETLMQVVAKLTQEQKTAKLNSNESTNPIKIENEVIND